MPAKSAASPAKLVVGIVQLCSERQLPQNRDKIAAAIRQAKERGCRVVVFPEGALCGASSESPDAEIADAVTHLQQVVQSADIYAVIPGIDRRDAEDKPFNNLLVIDPNGTIIQRYNKLWFDERFDEAPGPFEIDGVPCAAAICADRWIRSVEELPALGGAKILFECSNNYDTEWIPEFGWYWCAPRALRNEVYVVFANSPRGRAGKHGPGHGHSAVIAPDGSLLGAAGDESDKLLVVELDLAKASGGEALKRRNHPLFQPFWETGLSLLAGRSVEFPPYKPLVSPEVELKIAAAQTACSQDLDENVAKIVELIRVAAAEKADVVVFPELAITGARDTDIAAVTQADVEAAVATLKDAAKEAEIYVVCGLPWEERGQRYNSAIVIDPQGAVLTRYAQLVVDRSELFTPGMSAKAMWFEIKGVPAVVTIGRDALWSEIAELAALRGAQVHLHLSYDRDTSAAGDLRRKQLWANLATFRTFTATVNAASPARLAHPSAPASGGSAIWDDYRRGNATILLGTPFWRFSASRLAEAKEGEAIFYATQTVEQTNWQFERVTGTTNPQMAPWYAKGAEVIYTEQPVFAPIESAAER